MGLSSQNLERLRAAVAARGLAAIARELGVNRSSLASVLISRARPCTSAAVAQAFVSRAGQVVGS